MQAAGAEGDDFVEGDVVGEVGEVGFAGETATFGGGGDERSEDLGEPGDVTLFDADEELVPVDAGWEFEAVGDEDGSDAGAEDFEEADA